MSSPNGARRRRRIAILVLAGAAADRLADRAAAVPLLFVAMVASLITAPLDSSDASAAESLRDGGRRHPAVDARALPRGRAHAPGVREGANSAGAMGCMQFLASTWARYGVDGNNKDGKRDERSSESPVPGSLSHHAKSGTLGSPVLRLGARASQPRGR